ncbi:MAG TPA: MFS transporter [Thermoleophilaceae bacterium]|nr:MFS transporter [Thermoleophilaceae bacterium]
MHEAAGDDRSWDPAARWRGLAVVCAAMVISAVDMTIVNVALPDISRELDATLGELQWVLDGFLVALAGMLAVASGVADRFGRRRVFLAGMAGFGVASLLCALAPAVGWPGVFLVNVPVLALAIPFGLRCCRSRASRTRRRSTSPARCCRSSP